MEGRKKWSRWIAMMLAMVMIFTSQPVTSLAFTIGLMDGSGQTGETESELKNESESRPGNESESRPGNESESEPDENAVLNVVTFEIADGAAVKVDDEEIADEGTAMAKDHTIIFTVTPEEGYEITSVLVDGEKDARHTLNEEEEENEFEYIIEGIQTDETIVSVETQAVETEAQNGTARTEAPAAGDTGMGGPSFDGQIPATTGTEYGMTTIDGIPQPIATGTSPQTVYVYVAVEGEFKNVIGKPWNNAWGNNGITWVVVGKIDNVNLPSANGWRQSWGRDYASTYGEENLKTLLKNNLQRWTTRGVVPQDLNKLLDYYFEDIEVNHDGTGSKYGLYVTNTASGYTTDTGYGGDYWHLDLYLNVKPYENLAVEKKVINDENGTKKFKEGETVEFEITVTNKGTTTLRNIHVTDELFGVVLKEGSAYTIQDGQAVIDTLNRNEIVTIKASYVVQKNDLGKGIIINRAVARWGSNNTVRGQDTFNVADGTINVTVQKTWNHGEADRTDKQTQATVELKNGDSVVGSAVLWDDAQNNMYTWEDQSADGTYSIAETPVPGYKTTVAGPETDNNGNITFKVTNTFTGEGKTRDITVKKEWVAPEGTIFDPVTVTLKGDVEQKKRTLSQENGWSVEFENLPKYNADGTLILYTVEEEAVSGYEVSYSSQEPNQNSYTITNKKTEVSQPQPEKNVTKINGITVTYNGQKVKAGDNVTYSISYYNNKNTAQTITITDKLPAGVNFISASHPGSNNQGTVTWEIANVQPFTGGTVDLTVEITEEVLEGADLSDPKVSNTASVKVDDQTEMNSNTLEIPVEEELVSVAVYATDGYPEETEVDRSAIKEVLGLGTIQPDGYWPIGVIELPRRLFVGKNSPYIKKDADFDAVMKAVGNIDKSYLTGSYGESNKNNVVGEKLEFVQRDLGQGSGSLKTALFDWNGEEAQDAIRLIESKYYRYHLDLRFACRMVEVKGVYPDGCEVSLGKKVYLVGQEINEENILGDTAFTKPDNLEQEGNVYFLDEDFTHPVSTTTLTAADESLKLYCKLKDELTINVTKVWEGDTGKENQRPENITYQLYKEEDGEKVPVETKTVNASENWGCSFSISGAEKYKKYIVEEATVNNYKTSYNPAFVQVEHKHDVDKWSCTETVIVTNTLLTPKLEASKTLMNKGTDEDGKFKAGDTAKFSITVTNAGNTTQERVIVTEQLAGATIVEGEGYTIEGGNAVITDLTPGATVTVEAEYTVKQADIDSDAELKNIALVNGDNGTDPDPTPEVEIPKEEQNPELEVHKTVAGAIYGYQAGDTVKFYLSVKNTGNVTLYDVSLKDELPGVYYLESAFNSAWPPVIDELAPGESSRIFIAYYVVTEADLEKGEIENTATADGYTKKDHTEEDLVTGEHTVSAATEEMKPAMTVEKATVNLAAGSTEYRAGDSIEFVIRVTNTGNVKLNNVTVTEQDGAEIIPGKGYTVEDGKAVIGSIEFGGFALVHAQHTLTQEEIDGGTYTNVATAAAEAPNGGKLGDDADKEVNITNYPGLSSTKTLTNAGSGENGAFKANETATFDIVVENTGNTTQHDVVVTDTMAGAKIVAGEGYRVNADGTATIVELAPDTSVTVKAEYTVTQADIDNQTELANMATVSGEGTTTGPDPEKIPTEEPAPKLTVHKSVLSSNYGYQAGDTVKFHLYVENTGNVTLYDVKLTDDGAYFPESAFKEWPPVIEKLAPGEKSQTFTAYYTVTQDDFEEGGFTNTATAAGYDRESHEGKEPNVNGEYHVPVYTGGMHPALDVKKAVSNLAAGINEYHAGDTVEFTVRVTNTGDVKLTEVTVSEQPGAGIIPGDGYTVNEAGQAVIAEMASGDVVTVHAQHALTQDEIDTGAYENEVTVAAKPPKGPVTTGQADAGIVIKSYPGLTAEKTLTNSGTGEGGAFKAGDTAEFDIKVTNSGNTTQKDVIVTEQLAGAAIVAGDGYTVNEAGEAVITKLAPGESVTVKAAYTVTQEDIDSIKPLKNIALVDGGPGTDPDPTPETEIPKETQDPKLSVVKRVRNANYGYDLGDEITYTVEVTNTGNVTLKDVVVTDPLTKNSWKVEELEPGETERFITYAYTVTEKDITGEIAEDGTPVNAGIVTNTAKATGTAPNGDEVSAEASLDVKTVNERLSLEAVKTLTNKGTGENGAFRAGETATFDITVKNTGNTTRADVTVTDTMTGAKIVAGDGYTVNEDGTATITEIAPGKTVTVKAEYTVTQADIDNQTELANTATVGGDGDTTGPDPEPIQTEEPKPGLKVTKRIVGSNYGYQLGGKVRYHIIIENTGNVTLSDIMATDKLTGSRWLSGSNLEPANVSATLAPGESTDFYTEYTVTEADILKGEFVNVAEAEGKTPDGGTVNAEASVKAEPVTPNGHLTVTKETTNTPAEGAAYKLGETISYKITVTNDGNLTIENVEVSDPLTMGVGIYGIDSLAPGESKSFETSYKVKESDILAGHVLNVATATGTSPDPKKPDVPVTPGEKDVPTQTPNPSLFVEKTADKTSDAKLGETITYTITVTNNGNVTLTDVKVTDPLTGNVDDAAWTIGSFAPGATQEFTATYVVTEADILAGKVKNTATAAGTDPEGNPVTATGEEEVDTEDGAPRLQVEKRIAGAGNSGYALGDKVKYNIHVTNTGNLTVTNIWVTDILGEDQSEILGEIVSLAPGESRTFTMEHTVTEEDILAGEFENVATARGDASNGEKVEAHDSVWAYTVKPNGHLTVTKTTTSEPKEGTAYKLGETITYEITATNDGNLTLTDITVTDELTGDEWTIESLAPGKSETFTTSHTVTEADILKGKAVNVATATGKSPDPDEPDVPVDPGKKEDPTEPKSGHLTITKETTNTPENGKTYGLGETINYKITVTNDGNLTITDITVLDSMTKDSWKVDFLVPGGNRIFEASHVVTEKDILAGSVLNSATGWGKSPDPEKPNVPVDPGTTEDETSSEAPELEVTKTVVGHNADYKLGETVTFHVTVTNTGNLTVNGITVTDDLTGDNWAAGSLAPGEKSRTFTATHEVTEKDIRAGSFENTAVATGTASNGEEVSDDDTVKVIPEALKSHLTIRKEMTSTPSEGGAYKLGETITYEITATNDGNQTLTDVKVADELTGNVGENAWLIESLAPGESQTFTAEYVVTEKDIRAGHVLNEATSTDVPTDPGKDDEPTQKPAPSLFVEKTAEEKAGGYKLGEKITFTVTVTNNGNVTLHGIKVTDPRADESKTLVENVILKPGEIWTEQVTCTVTEADILTGTVTNTATAAGLDPNDHPVYGSGKATVHTEDNTPKLQVTKSVAGLSNNGYELGAIVYFNIHVTNTGSLTLNNVEVTDALVGYGTGRTMKFGSLAPGETKSVKVPYVVTEADILAGRVVNEATATGTAKNGKTAEGWDDAAVYPEAPNGHLTVTKTTTSEPKDDGTAYKLGETITYEITVTNDGNLTITGITVTDELTGNTGEKAWTIDSLAPGKSQTFTTEHVVTEADILAGKVVNVATATGKSPDMDKPDVPVTPGDTEDPTDPKNGHLTITKETTSTPANGKTYALGEMITYEITVTNDGNLTLTGITVTDELTGNTGEKAWTIDSLAPGASQTFTARHVVTEADILAGNVVNEATATGTSPDPDEPEVPVDPGDTEDPTDPQAPKLEVKKTITGGANSGYDLGDAVTFHVTVKNKGNLTITNITVTDERTGDTWMIDSLEPGETSEVFTATYTVTEEDILAGRIVNTAVANGTAANDKAVTAQDAALAIPVKPNGHLTVTKETTSTPANGSAYGLGEEITYSVTVTNDGNLTITGITVTDELTGNVDEKAWTIESLAPGGRVTFTAEYVVTEKDILAGSVKNVATATGKSPDPKKPDVPVTPGEDDEPTQTPNPSLYVEKTADKTNGVKLGETIEYTITVTNNGNVTISDITVSDLLTGDRWPGMPQAEEGAQGNTIVLEPGGKISFTATHTVTEGDILAGRVENVATASGKDPEGNTVTDSGSSTITTETGTPKLLVEKRIVGLSNSGYELGGTVTFHVTVKNTGNLTIRDITMTDELTGNVDEKAWTIDSLAPGETSEVFTATYTVTEADILAGRIENTAVANGTAANNEPVKAQDAALAIPVKPNGHLTIKKETTSTPANGKTYALGEMITYEITVTNDGNLTITGITVTDELTGNTGENAWTIDSLAPGKSQTFTTEHVVTEADILAGKVVNVATATGTSPDPDEPEVPVDPGDTEDTTEPKNGHLTIEKTTISTPKNGETYALGETIRYKITATNDGNLTITDITVTDKLTQDSWTIDSLAPGESQTFTARHVVTEADILAGNVVNEATATGTSPDPEKPDVPVTPDDTDDPTDPQAPKLEVQKMIVGGTNSGYELGDAVTFHVTVKNTGNLTVTGITVTDEMTGNKGDDAWKIESLAPGETSDVFEATYTVTEADILAGKIVNTAVAEGTAANNVPVRAQGAALAIPVKPNGHLTVTKETTSTPANGSAYGLGEEITYSVTVKNDGNLTITGITVTDELTGNTGENAWTIDSLAPGATSEVFTASHVVTEADILAGSVLNVATATGTSPDPNEPEVPVTPGEKEDPTQTPSPSLFVEKTAEVKEGGYALGETITYTITVTNNGNVTVSDITVSDPLTDDTWTEMPQVEEGAQSNKIVLEPGDTVSFTAEYTVTEEDILAGRVENTATATGTDPNGGEVTGSDDETATTVTKNGHLTIEKTTTSTPANGSAYALGETIAYSVTVTNDGNLTITDITVTDELTGNKGENAWTIESLEPGASETFEASYVVTEADILEGKVVNEATATGTSPDPEKPEVPVEPGDTEDPTDPKNGHLTITKETTSTPANGETYALGEKITYSITAKNDGNLTLTGITVTDELTGNTGENAWTIESLEPGASETFTAEYTVTEKDILAGKVVNVATAEGTSPDPEEPEVPVDPGDTEDPTDPKNGHLTITKETTSTPANGEAYALGETITYSITATNDGNLTLTGITVTDELTGNVGENAWTIEALEPGASETFTASYVVTEADILAGTVLNVATATGTSPDPEEPNVPVEPGEKEDPTDPKNGHVTITKATTSTPANGVAYIVGETIAYEITVTNDGNLTVTGITVTDELTGNTGENAWTIESLAPGASQTFTAEYIVTEADAAAGSVLNVATATGTSPDPEEPEVPVEPGEKEDPIDPHTASITVSKTNIDALNDEVIALPNAQFRVALFADAALTQQAGAAQTITFGENDVAAETTFSNLNSGVYYVAEVDEAGAIISLGDYDGGEFVPTYPAGQQVTVAETGAAVQFSFANRFLTLPREYYQAAATLNVTKLLKDASGNDKDSNETFYAGIFSDADYSTLADNVMTSIVPLNMGGGSSVSQSVEVTVSNNSEVTLYVTEVDANGRPVEGSASFAYDVTVENMAVTLAQGDSAETIITNVARNGSSNGGEPQGDTIINEGGEGEDVGVPVSTGSVKTGDDTPIALYLILLLGAALILIIGILLKRRSRDRM